MVLLRGLAPRQLRNVAEWRAVGDSIRCDRPGNRTQVQWRCVHPLRQPADFLYTYCPWLRPNARTVWYSLIAYYDTIGKLHCYTKKTYDSDFLAQAAYLTVGVHGRL